MTLTAYGGFFTMSVNVQNRIIEGIKIRDLLHRKVMEYLETRTVCPGNMIETDGIKIRVTDLSSLPNLRWSPEPLLEALLSGPGKGSRDEIRRLTEFRKRDDFSRDRWDRYQNLLQENLDRICTGYSYCNVNLCDFDSLEKLFMLMIPGKQHLADALRREMDTSGYITHERFREIMGRNYQTVFPVVNVSCGLNVNSLSKPVLTCVLQWLPGIADPETAADKICTLRDEAPLEESGLRRILAGGGEVSSRIFSVLGTETWFYKITADGRGRKLTVVAALIPGAVSRWKIIREKYQ
ncbi:MAG: hypothetical protein ACLFSE_08395 [Spirochaetia bacterium]